MEIGKSYFQTLLSKVSSMLPAAVGFHRFTLMHGATREARLPFTADAPDKIRGKLVDLALGNWRGLNYVDKSNKNLRLPLAKNQCGHDLSILWQVDIGVVRGTRQQILKVWEVGNDAQACLLTLRFDYVLILSIRYSK